VTQTNRIAAPFRSWQKQYRFLNIGGQEEQVHDLRDASTGYMAELGQFGVAADHTGTY
jgi:hypothetical protein